MFRRLKINTAILISMAFVFRLLFVNIGIISSLRTTHNSNFIKSHFSSIMKRRKHFEPINGSGNNISSLVEICEEEAGDDDNQLDSDPFLFIQTLYFLASSRIKTTFEKINPFYNYLSYTSSHRYLAFRVFRI